MKVISERKMIENCSQCTARHADAFCGLSPSALSYFAGAGHRYLHPSRAVLFVEGQAPRGVFMVCSGAVKLFTTSNEGKTLILRMAGPGDIIGLSALLTNSEYELTAETTVPSQLNFIRRDTFLSLIQRNPEFGFNAARCLSREYEYACQEIHSLAMARSSAGKLARLLLSWTSTEKQGTETRLHSTPTHEEMAQMIGASRETVTRLMGQLKKKQWVRQEGPTLVISNRSALEAMIA
jgi:CRP/FNR family transcriptional regulator, cyclic AMP receptor protein